MIRIGKSEKWNDSFFLNLGVQEKLLFIYLYENCDEAGFFDINFEKMNRETGITNEEIGKCLNNLQKTYLLNQQSTKLWIKKFLLHQNKLPIDLKSTDGNFIKFQLENNMLDFGNPKEFYSIVSNPKKNSRKKTDGFTKPTLQEIVDNFKTGEWSHITKDEIINLYDYYESVGWKVGNKKMADWNKAFIGCFRRNYKRFARPNQFNNNSNSKLDLIIEQNKKIENFDFNTLR